jgi:hypothetical protein
VSNEGDPGVKYFFFSCLLLLLPFVSGCLSSTPFQSARVVEPGQQAASMSLQKSVDANEDQDYSWYMLEFAGRFPVYKSRVDFALNGAIMALEDEDGLGGIGAMFGLGPKFELLQDILAIEVPVRVMFAGEATFESTHFYPRAILSLPVSELVEINLSHTRYYYLEEVDITPYGFSAGLAIGRKGGVIIRPEIGIVVFPEGHDVLQFGIGFTPESSAGVDPGKLDNGTPH